MNADFDTHEHVTQGGLPSHCNVVSLNPASTNGTMTEAVEPIALVETNPNRSALVSPLANPLFALLATCLLPDSSPTVELPNASTHTSSSSQPLVLGKATDAHLYGAELPLGQFHTSVRRAYLNGAPINVTHDSGADATFFPNETVETNGLVVTACQPVEITLADGSTIITKARCKARLRILMSSDTKPRYHTTTVTGYVLPPPAVPSPARTTKVDVFLGLDWLYANKAKLDYSTYPFTISYDAHTTMDDSWDNPSLSGLQVLQYATNTLYAASTVPLLTDRQCKRLLRQRATAAKAFTVVVRQANQFAGSVQLGPMPAKDKTTDFSTPPVSLVAGGAHSSPGKEHAEQSGDSLHPQAVPMHDSNQLPDVGDGPCSPEHVSSLLQKYQHVFAEPIGMPPDRELESTVIPLIDNAKPQFVRGWRLSPAELAEVQKQVKDLLAKGYIQPSSSPWGAPVLFVPKPDGTFRMAIDYRKLNSVTVPNRWPLPHIDELLNQVRDARVFSLLDLRSGYHQLRLAPEDVPKTAFISPVGLYEYRVLPFGLCNAPAVFTRYMTKVLAPMLGKSVVVYLDDILVFSNTPADHLKHLEQLFQLLEQHQLFAKGTKCSLNRTELRYLGHIIGHGKVSVDPAKITAISSWPLPQFPKELQSFLGLANYFCKFLQGYSSLAAPLTTLVAKTAPKTKRAKGEPFTPATWTAHHTAAFEGIKQALCSAPVLVLPDPNAPYRLIADASELGTGAVLLQHNHPVAYLSHKFNETESRYHTGEKELLAVILALKAWRCYLHGCPGGLTLVTDHHPLTYLQKQPHLSPKQVRWSQFMSQFLPFEWEYIEGRSNVADPLSRHPMLASISVSHFPERTPPSAPFADRIQTAYADDPWFADTSNTAALICTPDGFWKGGEASASSASNFSAKQPSVEQIVVPDNQQLKHDLLHEFHDSVNAGHPGMERTLELIARYFWWPGMLLDVHQYVRTCSSCQLNKATHRRIPPIVPLSIPVRRWDSISMDFVTSLPRCARFDTICVVVDRLTKFAIFIPTTEHVTAQKTAELFVKHVASRFGLPSEIVSDRDPRFTSTFWAATLKLFGTKHAMSTPYHPQSDGQTERMNRLLEETLRHYVNANQTNWVSLLPLAEFAINNAWQSTIQSTPFYLNHGQHPRVPAAPPSETEHVGSQSFVSHIAAAVQNAKQSMSAAHDRMRARHTGTPPVYTIGQQVLLSTKHLATMPGLSSKLSHSWTGPFLINRVITKGEQSVAVELQLPPTWKSHPVVSVSMVKHYHERLSALPPDAVSITRPVVQHLVGLSALNLPTADLLMHKHFTQP